MNSESQPGGAPRPTAGRTYASAWTPTSAEARGEADRDRDRDGAGGVRNRAASAQGPPGTARPGPPARTRSHGRRLGVPAIVSTILISMTLGFGSMIVAGWLSTASADTSGSPPTVPDRRTSSAVPPTPKGDLGPDTRDGTAGARTLSIAGNPGDANVGPGTPFVVEPGDRPEFRGRLGPHATATVPVPVDVPDNRVTVCLVQPQHNNQCQHVVDRYPLILRLGPAG